MEKTLEVHLQEDRERIWKELLQVAKENQTYILPIEIVYAHIIGKPINVKDFQ